MAPISAAGMISSISFDRLQNAPYHSSGSCSLKFPVSMVWITELPVETGSPFSFTTTALTAVVPISKVAANIYSLPVLYRYTVLGILPILRILNW